MHMAKQTWGTRAAIVLLGAIISITSAGCLAIEGGDRTEARNPTVGRQLIDLKAARDNGAISQDEYERTKTKILNENH